MNTFSRAIAAIMSGAIGILAFTAITGFMFGTVLTVAAAHAESLMVWATIGTVIVLYRKQSNGKAGRHRYGQNRRVGTVRDGRVHSTNPSGRHRKGASWL